MTLRGMKDLSSDECAPPKDRGHQPEPTVQYSGIVDEGFP